MARDPERGAPEGSARGRRAEPTVLWVAKGERPTTCRYCGRAVWWAERGMKRVPVDCAGPYGQVPDATRAGAGTPHHLTCSRRFDGIRRYDGTGPHARR